MSICRIILLLFVSLARAYHEDLPRTVLVHFHLPKSGGEYVNSVFDSKVDFTYTRITYKNRQNTWQAVKLTSSVALDTGMHFLEVGKDCNHCNHYYTLSTFIITIIVTAATIAKIVSCTQKHGHGFNAMTTFN